MLWFNWEYANSAKLTCEQFVFLLSFEQNSWISAALREKVDLLEFNSVIVVPGCGWNVIPSNRTSKYSLLDYNQFRTLRAGQLDFYPICFNNWNQIPSNKILDFFSWWISNCFFFLGSIQFTFVRSKFQLKSKLKFAYLLNGRIELNGCVFV